MRNLMTRINRVETAMMNRGRLKVTPKRSEADKARSRVLAVISAACGGVGVVGFIEELASRIVGETLNEADRAILAAIEDDARAGFDICAADAVLLFQQVENLI